jgi:hypothetical protein
MRKQKMTIASAAALLAAFSTTSPPREPAEIVVTARERLKDWRGTTRLRNGKYICRTRDSSGDREIDAIACRALATCMDTLKPEIDAAIARKPPPEEQAAISKAFDDKAGACFGEHYENAVARLDADRDAARDRTRPPR